MNRPSPLHRPAHTAGTNVRRAVALTLVAALTVGVPIGPVLAGGNIEELDSGPNFLFNIYWDERMFTVTPPGLTGPLNVDWFIGYGSGHSASFPSYAQVQAAIQGAFDAWESLPDNILDFDIGNPPLGTTSQSTQGVAASNTNQNVMIFSQTTGADPGYIAVTPCNAKIVTSSITDLSESPNGNGMGWLSVPNNGGANRNAVRVPVTTSGSSDYFIGAIGDCDVLFNTKLSAGAEVIPFSTTGVPGAEDLQAITTHELGHFNGLSHSPIADATMYAFSKSNPAGDADGLGARTLHTDDISSAGHIYGTAAFDAAHGAITGTVFFNGGRGDGVHVTALRASDFKPVAGRFSISQFMDPDDLTDGADFTANGAGFYRLDGLPPGDYYVRAEWFDPTDEPWSRLENRYNTTVGNSEVADGSLVDPPGPSGILPQRFEFHNTGDSANGGNGTTAGVAVDNPDEATLVSVAAGGVVGGIDIQINLDPDTGKTIDERGNPTGLARHDLTASASALTLLLLDDDGNDDDWMILEFPASELPTPPYNIQEGIWGKFGRSDAAYIGGLTLSAPGGGVIEPPIVFDSKRFVAGSPGGGTGMSEIIDIRDAFNVTVTDARDVFALVKFPESPPGISFGSEGYFTVFHNEGAPGLSTGRSLLTIDNFQSLLVFNQHDMPYRLRTETAPAVRITGAAPNTLSPGTTGTVVTISGNGFKPGADVDFLAPTFGGPVPSGVTVTNVSFVNATTLTATVDVAANAGAGILDVEVTNPGVLVPNRARLMSVIGVDGDGDGVNDPSDCLPADASVWAQGDDIGDTLDVTEPSAGVARLTWVAGSTPGGTPAATSWDVVRGDAAALRTSSPTDFGTCHANDHGSVTLDDPIATTPGQIWIYMVAERTACGRSTFGSAARDANAGNCAP